MRATRPRRWRPSLHADPKEQAEHVMIVDLERNDLGRVCRTGSVRVDEFARVHTLSVAASPGVEGRRGDCGPDTHWPMSAAAPRFRAGRSPGRRRFAPWRSSTSWSRWRRGFYTGAIGFIGVDGDAVFNLAIRTAVATPGDVHLPCRRWHRGGLDSGPRVRGNTSQGAGVFRGADGQRHEHTLHRR